MERSERQAVRMNQEEKYFIENEHIPECFMYVTMDAWASVGIPLLHII